MSLWKNKAFTYFFASFAIGNIGDWFDVFALQIIALHEWHASPIALGILWLFFFLPSIIFGPIAGVWADKISKRNVMINTDAAAALLTMGLYFTQNLYLALVIIFVRTFTATLNAPAQQAYIKHVVTDEQLLQASSVTTIVFKMCQVIGPMLGALLLLVTSARTCLLVNAVSFIVSVIFLLTLKKDEIEERKEVPMHWSKDMLTGAKHIWKNRILRTLVSITALWFFCSLVRQAQLPVFLQTLLPGDKHALGFFMGFDGFGAVISGVILSRKKEIQHIALYFLVGFILIGLSVLGLSFYKTFWTVYSVYLFAFTIGLGTGILLVAYGYLLKRETDKTQMGRVSSTASTIGSIALALGTVSSGFLVLHFGIREVYLGISIILVVLAVLSCLLFQLMPKSIA